MRHRILLPEVEQREQVKENQSKKQMVASPGKRPFLVPCDIKTMGK